MHFNNGESYLDKTFKNKNKKIGNLPIFIFEKMWYNVSVKNIKENKYGNC